MGGGAAAIRCAGFSPALCAALTQVTRMRRERSWIRTRCRPKALSRHLCLLSACLWLMSWTLGSSTTQTPSTTADLQAQLIARLAAADEESRIDAATRLANLFRQRPEGMPPPVIAALGQALQNDHSPVVRALAARAFEAAGDARVV